MRRNVSGEHSWAISKVKELESGELYPLEWFCRDCRTTREISFTNKMTYRFPEGHEKHFPEGLPPSNKAGTCPASGKAEKEAIFAAAHKRLWGEL